ncbi:MAG: biotin attachment protein [Clostridiales bacterium]|nr:biotin attachment protein [Clostridiales bacterium]
MKQQILMPKLRPGMEKGVLCSWSVRPGERVEKGDVLFEVETDKVVSQIESNLSGVVSGFLADEGDEVAVGEPVATLETER